MKCPKCGFEGDFENCPKCEPEKYIANKNTKNEKFNKAMILSIVLTSLSVVIITFVIFSSILTNNLKAMKYKNYNTPDYAIDNNKEDKNDKSLDSFLSNIFNDNDDDINSENVIQNCFLGNTLIFRTGETLEYGSCSITMTDVKQEKGNLYTAYFKLSNISDKDIEIGGFFDNADLTLEDDYINLSHNNKSQLPFKKNSALKIKANSEIEFSLCYDLNKQKDKIDSAKADIHIMFDDITNEMEYIITFEMFDNMSEEFKFEAKEIDSKVYSVDDTIDLFGGKLSITNIEQVDKKGLPKIAGTKGVRINFSYNNTTDSDILISNLFSIIQYDNLHFASCNLYFSDTPIQYGNTKVVNAGETVDFNILYGFDDISEEIINNDAEIIFELGNQTDSVQCRKYFELKPDWK